MNKISKATFIVGTILNIAIGSAGIASAVYIYKNPFMEVDKEITKNQAMKQCTNMLRNNGFQADANLRKKTIEVSHYGLEKWETSIAKMSYVFQSCEALDMSTFCMGSECKTSKNAEVSGIVASLKYNEPIKK